MSISYKLKDARELLLGLEENMIIIYGITNKLDDYYKSEDSEKNDSHLLGALYSALNDPMNIDDVVGIQVIIDMVEQKGELDYGVKEVKDHCKKMILSTVDSMATVNESINTLVDIVNNIVASRNLGYTA